MRLYVRDWDFRLDEIHMPLKLFHGEQDRNAPIAMAMLPDAELVTYENEAHLSTLCNCLAEFAPAVINRQ